MPRTVFYPPASHGHIIAALLSLAACGGRVELESNPPDVADATPVPPEPDASVVDASLPDAVTAETTTAEAAPPYDAPPDSADIDLLNHCLQGGNAMFVDGDPGEHFHAGPLSITQSAATWIGAIGDPPLGATTAGVKVSPSAPPNAMAWSLIFSTYVMGEPLRVQRYDNVTGGAGDATHASMSVVWEGAQPCTSITGWFDVKALDVLPESADAGSSSLHALTVTFEQHCNGAASALRGCVHFERP